MNKTKKLLSVLLAVLMALSCMSVMASAAQTNYRTVADLKALDAYSPYGQVTRLSTEERASIVLDFLDNTLAGLNIKMDPIDIIGIITIDINLTSVDKLSDTIAGLKSTINTVKNIPLLGSIAMGLLGIVQYVKLDSWDGPKRSGDQLAIFSELLELLSNNTDLVSRVLSSGTLDLGLIGNFLGNVDLSAVTDIIGDIPGLIKGLVFPKLERWDDTLTEVKWLDTNGKGDGKVEETVNTFVQNLFNNDMSITTVKYDANGNMTSEHTKMPFASAAPGTPGNTSPRMVYVTNGTTPGSTLTVYHIVDEKEAKDLAKTPDEVNGSPAAYTYFKEAQTYVMSEEVEGSGTYVWKAFNDNGEVVATLKWYNDDSQFLKGFDGNSINLTTMSAGELVYKFIPIVFDKLATVVLNGSLKKILAEFFGAKFTHIGTAGTEEILALGNDPIFNEEQGEYVFEWSDYAIVDGVHYYRYLDDVYVADLSAKNNYFDIIDWNYEIGADFMNEFVNAADPTNPDTRILLKLNDFLIKVANTITVPSAETVNAADGETATWTRPAFVAGSNANLISNIKLAAQTVIQLAPQHIFGSDYATNDRCYFDMLVADDNDTVLVGLAATLVDALMPSMSLPTVDEMYDATTKLTNVKVGAILAAVIREFASYLTPEFNYDALIYTDFGETDGVKNFVTGKDNNYWLDVILTMGINIGFEYIRAFADMGEGTTEWASFVTYSGYGVDGKTYAAGTTREALNAEWEGMLDYVIDWALDKDYEWTWKMENLVEVDGLTIDLSTAQDPFEKLDKILFGIIPFDEILKIEPAEGQTRFEHFLRDDLILGLIDLKWDHLINTVEFNGENNYFRTGNVLDQLAKLLKGIVNGLLDKIGGGDYKLIPDSATDFDSLATKTSVTNLAVGLVGKLKTAYDNGLIATALPILNMFLGWKMDPQAIADPQIWTSFRDGNDYAFQYNVVANGAIDAESTLIKILNNSAGMLETHRNSSVEDHAYDIQIRSVTSDATTNTLSFTYSDGDGLVSPYETVDIKVGGTYRGEEAVTVTIAYDYVGKDGQAIGGTQYKTISFLVSNQYEDANIDGRKDGDDDEDYAGIDQYKKYQFTEDIYGTITNFKPTIFATTGSTGATGARDFAYIKPYGAESDCDGNVTAGTGTMAAGQAATYFEIHTTQAESQWPDQKPASGTISGYLYKAKDGVTAGTEFPYGHYDMGSVTVKYGSAEKEWEIDFIYYNSYGIYDIYTENMNNNYHANQGVPADIYNAYNDAWKLIVYGATYPMMTTAAGSPESVDYVKAIQPYIPQAIADFEAAKEAYEDALAEAQASGSAAAKLPTHIETLATEIENDFMNGKEINFQDYEFYEYFNYNDVKTAAENLYRTYLAPEIMDKYYIQGSGISEAELDAVIDAEANEFIAAGIEASRMENSEEAINASIAAHNDWKAPITTKLVADDFTSRLAFYKQFLNEANREDADHLYFLNKEIAFVEAQNLVEADYEAVTWGRYADALAEAKAVAAGTDEFSEFNSRIYDVKYNLMVAYKQLLAKADSLIVAGGTAALNANIDTAKAIFASLAAGDGAWALAADYEGEADDAYAALISALGYYYVGEDGNTWNLYADSALEYADNDRPNKQGNQAKVDAANEKLELAIANFEAAAPAEPNTLVLNENAPFEAIIDTDNTIGGEYTGTVYGFDTLGYNDNWEMDGAIADFLSTAYGDEYLEVIVGDSGVETTGTVINVLDNDGNVVESYMFVYFGDMDMDGAVGFSDSGIAFDYEMMFVGIDSLATFMAGDMDNDTMPGFSDAGVMFDWEMLATGMPLQADIAAGAYGIVYEIY